MAAEVLTGGTDRPRAKACIFLFMWGGPAHQDTWDMKPLAPAEYRGEFQPIQTRVPGLQICEHLPKLAARADKLAIIRSMTHDDVDHTSATHYPLTSRCGPGGRLAEYWIGHFPAGVWHRAVTSVCFNDACGSEWGTALRGIVTWTGCRMARTDTGSDAD